MVLIVEIQLVIENEARIRMITESIPSCAVLILVGRALVRPPRPRIDRAFPFQAWLLGGGDRLLSNAAGMLPEPSCGAYLLNSLLISWLVIALFARF